MIQNLVTQAVQSFLLIIAFVLLMGVPFSAYAAEEVIDEVSLTSSSSKPTLFGTVTDSERLRITIYKEGSAKVFYKSRTIRVRDDVWKTRVSKKLPDGSYEVKVMATRGANRGVIATEKLVVREGAKRHTQVESKLVVAPIPLLFGGTARGGQSVPVAYLQITNAGKNALVLQGFRLNQNGSASVQSISGLTVVDDTGSAQGSVGGVGETSPFKNGTAFVPTAVTLQPGQMRLFTIKAILADNSNLYLGKQLMLDVTAVETTGRVVGQFPLRGTTWTITN